MTLLQNNKCDRPSHDFVSFFRFCHSTFCRSTNTPYVLYCLYGQRAMQTYNNLSRPHQLKIMYAIKTIWFDTYIRMKRTLYDLLHVSNWLEMWTKKRERKTKTKKKIKNHNGAKAIFGRFKTFLLLFFLLLPIRNRRKIFFFYSKQIHECLACRYQSIAHIPKKANTKQNKTKKKKMRENREK